MNHLTTRTSIAAIAATALALIAEASGAWSASTITVHRGAETTVVRPGSAGLDIGRGEPVTVRPPKRDISAGGVERVAAGRRLWIIDAEDRRLRVCVLARTTQVGERVIRCTTGDLPD